MAGQVGCFQGQDRSAVTHPSSSHARRCSVRLSCDNRCTRYTTPLATPRIEDACYLITPEMLQNVRRIFESRLYVVKKYMVVISSISSE
ncbi:hypothetical protein J6590_049636 [Homalodisca vitripennis]|nr:hypothetical protein J6590_049636 [Homalodisca vitripennis]